MWKKGKLKIPIKISVILTVVVLLAGGAPVFAFNMESKNYKLEIDSSDIKPIAQDFMENGKYLSFAGISLPKEKTTNIFKILIVIFVVSSLFLWIIMRIRKDFEIKKRKS